MIDLLAQPAIQQFIRDHEHHDPFQLVLQAKKYPDIPVKAVAGQIRAQQKAKTKLPHWYRKEGIVFASLLSLEQCSSEATARFKSKIMRGKHLVDLTGGAGVDTYFLSQSFDKVDYLEKNRELAEVTRHNFQVLGADNISVHINEAAHFLAGLHQPVDCIYLDPARRDQHAQKVFRLKDCTPDVVALLDVLFNKTQKVWIKTSPMLDIDAALQELKQVAQVYILAVNNECKEVLYMLDKEANLQPEITTVNLQHEEEQTFKFYKSEESKAEVTYAQPLQYIYEPNVSILKAGAFKSVGQNFQLHKLHLHTHLYTSDQLIPHFPGRIFNCEAVVPYNKKAVQLLLPEKKANITTRNFPDAVQKARKKLGLAEGGNHYLFLATTENGLCVIITRKAPY